MQLHHHSSGPVDLCQSMSEGSDSLSNIHFGASITRYGVYNPLLLIQWYWVFGVYQYVAEGAPRCTLDRLAESSDSLMCCYVIEELQQPMASPVYALVEGCTLLLALVVQYAVQLLV